MLSLKTLGDFMAYFQLFSKEKKYKMGITVSM